MMPQHDHASSSRSPEGSGPARHADLIARYGEKAWRLWHGARHPQRLLVPTTVGTVADAEGNCVSIALGIYGETIVETDFDAEGCYAIQIAAATAAHWARGKALDEAAAMDDQAILATLGCFPREKRHHTSLAATAVRDAVARWRKGAARGTLPPNTRPESN